MAGQKIKEARENAALTQDAVAALFADEVSRQAVNNWEAGKSFPRPGRWSILEQAFGLPEGWFLALKSGHELPVTRVRISATQNGVNNGAVVGIVSAAARLHITGDIARELCGLIAERLEGKNMDQQIELRAKVKRVLEEE